jgi:hypothetical protein
MRNEHTRREGVNTGENGTSVASRGTITFLPARRTLALEKFKYAFKSWQQTTAIAGGAFLQIFQCDA